jgi:hypothetical protein
MHYAIPVFETASEEEVRACDVRVSIVSGAAATAGANLYRLAGLEQRPADQIVDQINAISAILKRQ